MTKIPPPTPPGASRPGLPPWLAAWARPLLAALAWASSTAGACAGPSLDGARSWAVFYGAHAPIEALQAPDLLVLEPDHPWDLVAIRRPGQRVLAYLSLGEVHESRAYYAPLAATEGTLAGKNPNWPGAVMMDPRSPAWRQMVVETVAPAILAKGYDGLFLDTLDTAEFLEGKGHHPGAKAAMVTLLDALHAKFPRSMLLANGGLGLLPEAARDLAGLAIESVFTDYQFKTKTYRPREAAAALARSKQLGELKQRYGLPLFDLEYVDPALGLERARVAAQVRQAGFVPFVSDIGLASLQETP